MQGGESVEGIEGAIAGEAAKAAGAGGYKAHREAAQRADAGNRAAWNTLFMRPDTVAAAVAAHYGVSKAELLDRDAEGVPPTTFMCRTPYPNRSLPCCVQTATCAGVAGLGLLSLCIYQMQQDSSKAGQNAVMRGSH